VLGGVGGGIFVRFGEEGVVRSIVGHGVLQACRLVKGARWSTVVEACLEDNGWWWWDMVV
jgi:hypothetical protein